MPDGSLIPAWPLLLSERTAARMCDMTVRDFRAAVRVGLLPAGRVPHDLCRAGLIDPAAAAELATLGPLWHRAEIEARVAALYGLVGQAAAGQADRRAAARDALEAFSPRQAAARRRDAARR